MSTSTREVLYTCPYCGKQFSVQVYDVVDAQEDMDTAERCVSGDLFLQSCPHCKRDFMIQYPLLYIDREHRYVLLLSDTEAGDSLKSFALPLDQAGYVLRRCSTLAEFAEKIEELNDGVDDRIVELAKYDSFIEFTENKKGKPEEITAIEYQRTENQVMKINVRCGEEGDKGMSFHIPLSMMEEELKVHEDLYKVDNVTFPEVNSAWILSLFQEDTGKMS